jgi:hypothetical protein
MAGPRLSGFRVDLGSRDAADELVPQGVKVEHPARVVPVSQVGTNGVLRRGLWRRDESSQSVGTANPRQIDSQNLCNQQPESEIRCVEYCHSLKNRRQKASIFLIFEVFGMPAGDESRH